MATNITTYRNSSNTYALSVKQSDGSAQNITNAAIRMTARTSWSAGNTVFQLSVGSGITITDAANGKASITITPAHLSSIALAPTDLHYDVQVKLSGASNYVTVVAGVLTVLPGVS